MQTEDQRLEAISRYRILDTPPEATFDNILSVLKTALDVTGAFITFVDLDRSFYKSIVGIEYPASTPREDNMCDSVIAQDEVLVINDSHAAPEELVRPLLKAGMRFYAGAPLRTREGIKIGTVCVIDPRPREITDGERQILRQLSEVVIDSLELRLAALQMSAADEELRRLNRDLEAASRNKSEFLASMSHELRTPLNGILGASELLGQKLFGELNPKQAEYIEDIRRCGMHLLRLIEDVLDLSRVEAGQTQLDREVIDVAALMGSCAAVVHGAADAGSLTLSVEPPPDPVAIYVDERRITQVACNLLGNAIKFTPEGGRVLFKAWREEGRVVFLVQDNGPGIGQEFQERLFEQFYRVQNDKEGTGLGLPLAKQLIDLHGGRIWLDSAPGRGSSFFFSLPSADLQAG